MPLHFPPPVLALTAAVAQRVVGRRAPFSPTATAAASVVLAGSATLVVATFERFRDQDTTYHPIDLSGVSSLVTTGPNAVTRNPMYVGMAGVLVAHALSMRSWRAMLPVAAFVAVIDRTQIRREEEHLRAQFGRAYDDYCAQVPRWVGPVRARTNR